MPLKTDNTVRVVIYEGSGAQPLEAGRRFNAVSALLEKGFGVTRVTEGARVAPADRSAMFVLGDFGGSPPVHDGNDIRSQDIGTMDAASIASGLTPFEMKCKRRSMGNGSRGFQ